MGDGTPGTSIEKWSPPNFGFEEQMPHLRRRSKGVVVHKQDETKMQRIIRQFTL